MYADDYMLCLIDATVPLDPKVTLWLRDLPGYLSFV